MTYFLSLTLLSHNVSTSSRDLKRTTWETHLLVVSLHHVHNYLNNKVVKIHIFILPSYKKTIKHTFKYIVAIFIIFFVNSFLHIKNKNSTLLIVIRVTFKYLYQYYSKFNFLDHSIFNKS